MFRRSALVVAFATLALASEATPAAPLVELQRWDGVAALVPNNGPGVQLYQLPAQVRWSREAPRDPARYSMRMTLPGGQVTSHPIQRDEPPGSGQLSTLIPAASVRNLRPENVRLQVVVVDATTGAVVSNELKADIAQFPTPKGASTKPPTGPFGWGRPLEGQAGEARTLPRPGPDGLIFARIMPGPGSPGFFMATTEATIRQVKTRLPGFDPRAGRSDEFALEAPEQPAINLSPKQALAYLAGLKSADRSGITYRLPTQAEWLRAARAGKSTAFWWGDQPDNVNGANFIGPEPALKEDTTAPATPPQVEPTFVANPWGLFHTYGNAAEWATGPANGFVRFGGHFRTERKAPMPEVAVMDEGSTGPDRFVGVRPACDLSAGQGANLVRAALKAAPGLGGVQVAFDPDRATATLTGEVADPSARAEADRRLQPLWFLAAVENQLRTPTVDLRQLARLGPSIGQAKWIHPLGRRVVEVPLDVRWSDPLPVLGSEWYVNIFLPDGGHVAHGLIEPRPAGSKSVTVLLDRSKVPAGTPVRVALSLGAPAEDPSDSRIASNLADVPGITP